jgi:hypothetical protein
MMKLKTPAERSRAAHCHDREFGTSRTGGISSTRHETIALREADQQRIPARSPASQIPQSTVRRPKTHNLLTLRVSIGRNRNGRTKHYAHRAKATDHRLSHDID